MGESAWKESISSQEAFAHRCKEERVFLKYRVLSFFGQSRLLRASGQSEQNVDAPVWQRSQAQLSFGGPGPELERTEERSSWAAVSL